MLYRVKQFVKGFTAKIFDKDHAFIQKYLTQEESALFYQLRVSEQRHSLNIAYGCQSKAPQNTSLIRGALLHDIGKIGSNLTLLNKALVVISIKLDLNESHLPSFMKQALYYKHNHTSLGYDLLKPLHVEEEVLRLVRDHHLPNQEQWESMAILQHYDDLN